MDEGFSTTNPSIGDGADWNAALNASVRRTIFRPLLAGLVAILGVSVALHGLVAGLAPAAPGWALLSGLSGGLLAAIVTARWLSGAIAGAAARPAGLLVEQLEADDRTGFRWVSGRALGRAEILSDLKLLQRRSREIGRRAKVTIGDLERAREQANQQNLAKSQFLANMSHELRTPLNAILGYAMLLHEDASESGNPMAMADLDRIQQAGRNLLALINDILDLANVETGRSKIEKTVIDVRELAESVAWNCGAAESPNGNSFTLDIADGVDIMVGDSGKLRQCLVNLLKNGFKFTRAGTVTLQVSPVARDDAQWVEFSVSDTGIGIAPEHLDGLFDAFEQVNASATRQFGGTGLGLAVVRRLAATMGGECTVESIPQEGSVFRLLLPLGDVGSAGERFRLAKAGQNPPMIVATPSARHTALLIDDDEPTVELVQRWLVRMGYNVVSTTSAESALALARTHKPDFILLDVFLPQRSGYDLLEDFRADPAIAQIPTILITVDDDRARGLKAGATEFLRKPIREEQLREVLDVYRLRASGEILVIDDDDVAADLLTRCVAQVGFSARRACDGAEGLAMAKAIRPAAIVLDLAMPGMDGFEVLEHMAANELLRDVPLIVVSACDISLEEHRRLASAGHRFFAKAASTPREIAQSLKELVA